MNESPVALGPASFLSAAASESGMSLAFFTSTVILMEDSGGGAPFLELCGGMAKPFIAIFGRDAVQQSVDRGRPAVVLA